jgi:hypothetical protein
LLPVGASQRDPTARPAPKPLHGASSICPASSRKAAGARSARHSAVGVHPADVALERDGIATTAPPGNVASAKSVNAAERLIIPGLMNAHTHGHGGLAVIASCSTPAHGSAATAAATIATFPPRCPLCRSCARVVPPITAYPALRPVPTVKGLHVSAQPDADFGCDRSLRR